MTQPPSDWQATGGPAPDPSASNPEFQQPGQQGFPPPGQQQGFPPPGQGYPQPGQQGGHPGYGGATQRQAFDIKTISINGWGILGAGLLTLIAGLFPWWSTRDISASSLGLGSNRFSLSGFSQWWWIAILLAVAVSAIWAVQTFTGQLKQVKPLYLAGGAALTFVLVVITLIQTFIKDTVEYCALGFCATYGTNGGPSFGVFFALVTTAALLYFTAVWAQKSGASLPINIPTSSALDNRPFDGSSGSQGGFNQPPPGGYQPGGYQPGGDQQGGDQQGGYPLDGQGPNQQPPYQQGPPPGYQPPPGPPQQ